MTDHGPSGSQSQSKYPASFAGYSSSSARPVAPTADGRSRVEVSGQNDPETRTEAIFWAANPGRTALSGEERRLCQASISVARARETPAGLGKDPRQLGRGVGRAG